MDRFIRAPEVVRLTGLAKTTLWRLEKKGFFPKRILIGIRAVGWLEEDIEIWILQKRSK